MSKHTITVNVNGEDVTREVDGRTLLVHFIREDLSLTGTHIGCDTTSCGRARCAPGRTGGEELYDLRGSGRRAIRGDGRGPLFGS